MKVLIKDDGEKREYVSNVVVVTTPEFEKGADFDLSKPPDSALFQFLRYSADGVGCDSEPCSIVFKLHTARFYYADAFAKGMCVGFESIGDYPNHYTSDEQNNAFTAGLLAAEKSKVRPGTNFVYRLERVRDEAAFNLKFTWRAR